MTIGLELEIRSLMREPVKPNAAPARSKIAKAGLSGRGRGKSQRRYPEVEIVIGSRIRDARMAVHMSQTTLSREIGVSYQQLQKYEKGIDRVAVSTLQAIAVALDVNIVSMLNGLPIRKNRPDRSAAASRLSQMITEIRSPDIIKCLEALIDVIG